MPGAVYAAGYGGEFGSLNNGMTWSQLGIHDKPCGLLNTAGYFDDLIRFLDSAVDKDFLKPKHRALVIVENEPAVLLDRFDEILAHHVPTRLAQTKT